MDHPITRLAEFMTREGARLIGFLDQDGRLCQIEGTHWVERSGESHRVTLSAADESGEAGQCTLPSDQLVAAKAQLPGRLPRYFGDKSRMLEAEVLVRLGAVREEHASGRYAAAAAIGRECLDLVRRELGERHLDAVRVMLAVAGSLRLAGRLEEASRTAEAACSMGRQLLHPGDPLLAEVLHVRALTYADLGALPWARMMAEEVLKLQRTHGATPSAIANTLATLSQIARWHGEHDTASLVALDGLDALARASVREPGIHARLLHHRGMALAMGGLADAALPLLEESLAERREVLGHGHPETLEGMASLATLSLTKGDVRRAMELYRDAIAVASQALDDEHPVVADCELGLAFAYRRLGTLEAELQATALLARRKPPRNSSVGKRSCSDLDEKEIPR